MASQDDFEVATQKFLEWLPTMGITMSPKMQIADLRSEGRGRGVSKFPLYDAYCLALWQMMHCGSSCLLCYVCTRLCANQCLVATGDFEEDEVIFSIPRRSVINLKYTTDTYHVANIHASVPDLPPWLVHCPNPPP
jgi:SET domain-containing protein 6